MCRDLRTRTRYINGLILFRRQIRPTFRLRSTDAQLAHRKNDARRGRRRFRFNVDAAAADNDDANQRKRDAKAAAAIAIAVAAVAVTADVAAMLKRVHILKLFAIGSVLTSITNFPSGYTNSSVNTAHKEVETFISSSYAFRGYDLAPATRDLIHSAILNSWFVAQVVGSILAPLICDRFGRKCELKLAQIAFTNM